MPKTRAANDPAHNADLLLSTKLLPPRLHAASLLRPNLLERLDGGLAQKLTLVSAPTGYGKTTIVGMWIANRGLPTAWVTLDENDNDPARFWTYVCSALRRLDPELGKTTLSALAATQLPAYPTLLAPLINDLAQVDEACLLVLDEFHTISLAQILDGVSFLIQHLPERVHLVMISRGEPALNLGIYRARGEMLDITAADLRFDLAETQAFLDQTLAVKLPKEIAANLNQRSEGWAAGLRLATLSLQNRSVAEIEKFLLTFSGSHHYVSEYLVAEVFQGLPQALQDFLLKTCFLTRLTPSLCDAILESHTSAALLEQLSRDNLFITQLERSSGQTWYHYQPLFAEAIQHLARQRFDETAIAALYEKATTWFEYQQLFDDAIETALAAQFFERALGLVEKYIEIYSLNQMHTLLRWMERIPEALTLRHPAVCLMYAQVILFSSDRFAPQTAARIEPYLQAAEAAWQAAGDEARVGTVLSVRGMMLIWQGEFQRALECVFQALEKLPESEVFWRGISLLNAAAGEQYAGRMLDAQDQILEARALLGASQNIHGVLAANGMMAEIFYAQGETELCIQLCEQIIREAVGDESMLDDQGSAHLLLARIAYEQNDLAAAAQHAEVVIGLGKQRANELLQAQGAGVLAQIGLAQGKGARPGDDLVMLAAQLRSPLALDEIRRVESLLAVRSGGPPGNWLSATHEALPIEEERETFILARHSVISGKPAEALALLDPIVADAVSQGRVRSQVEALVLQALAQHALGDGLQARTSLLQALAIGHAKGFRRLIVDEGARMAALLREILPTLPRGPLGLYTSTLLHLFPPNTGSQRQAEGEILAPVEPLSQQEIRVLKLLVAGLSNGEIASELVVSTNTIKTHVKNIYRKLDITSREEARMVVKELKLF